MPRYGTLVLDDVTRSTRRGARPLDLTPAEYRLLRHLLVNSGQVLSKEHAARRQGRGGRGVGRGGPQPGGHRATAEAFAVDVTDRAGLARLADRVAERGALRAVAHAAGISPTMADWRRIFEVDLVGTVLLAEALRPLATVGTAHVYFASMSPMIARIDPAPDIAAILDDPLHPDFLDRIRDAVGPDIENTASPTPGPSTASTASPAGRPSGSARPAPASAPSPPVSSTPRRADRRRPTTRPCNG